jgi:glycosyltransferase involved in cell wall biosynthesis
LRIGIDARLAFRRGVGTYAANLIQALARVDDRNRYSIFNAPKALKALVAGNRFKWVDLPFANAAFYEQVLLPRVAAVLDLDLLHYVDNSASALTDLPVVVTLHDTLYQRPLLKVRPNPTFRQRVLWAYKQWAIPRSVPRAAAILTVSEFSKERIVNGMGLPSEKIFVTLEGVDREVFRPIPRERSKLFKALVHGAADDRKNLSNILKAARILAGKGRPFQFTIIGMDERELACTNLLREESDLGIGRQIDWVGNVPSESLPQVYAEADLLLYPSRWEGFGLPVLEAFACGVPVVTSKTTSLPEVAGKAALLVDPLDPEDIAGAVERVMKSAALRRRLVAAGSKRARLFTWDRTARETLKVYQKVGAEARTV